MVLCFVEDNYFYLILSVYLEIFKPWGYYLRIKKTQGRFFKLKEWQPCHLLKAIAIKYLLKFKKKHY